MNEKTLEISDFLLFKSVIQYAKFYKVRFSLAIFCLLASVGLGLIQPLIWGKLVTNLFTNNYYSALLNIIKITAIYISLSVITFYQSYLITYLTNNIVFKMKCDIYKRILSLEMQLFDEMRVGDFISRLNGDIAVIANFITNQCLNTLIDILKVATIGFIVFRINALLSVVIVVFLPLSYLIFFKFSKLLRKKSRDISSSNDNYFSYLQQSISGIREVKSLGIKNKNFSIFALLSESIKNKNIEFSMVNNLSQTLSRGINFLSEIAIMALGGFLIFKNLLPIEYFIAFLSYFNQLSGSLANLFGLNASIQQALTSLERILHLKENTYYSSERFGIKNIGHIKGNIKFENVTFQYKNGIPVLDSVSFEIPSGRKTAIVGSSGSGKTTIFNLLLRFYEPTAGDIFVDNIKIEEFSEESLREHIAIVRQEPFLFNLTIKENLLLANPLSTEEDIEEACKASCIHEYISGLPEKYETMIGENGINLSVGQKQRLAIARVLLKKSSIILFDEATSSLDNESQHYIKQIIDKLSKTHSVIIIAHRLITISEADEIIIIEDRKIAGRGTHPELINGNPVYRKLYEKELKIENEKKKEAVSY
ncbi:MAG: ABC transporter ATP-binding protein/permease [Clostridia bacterium]|nr:ABC transporter ATP-binding protein/permease [Clostridia bacterium]